MSAHADFATNCTELLVISMGDALYLKADEQSRPLRGSRRPPFGYTRQGKHQGLAFWTVPAEAMDSPALMRPWVQLAFADRVARVERR